MGGKKKQVVAPASAPLKPQGTNRKRTPQSTFDPAAGNDVYKPEKIVAQRMAKGGVTQYHVKWVGYEAKSNTWEPLENLAGCEDMIVEFKEREKQRLAELDAAALQKRKEKEAAAAKAAAEAAATAAAARVEAQGANVAVSPSVCSPIEENTANVKQVGSRRSSPIWAAFDTTGCPDGHAACKLLKPCGEVCGEIVTIKSGPTVMWNHAMHKHKADYMRLKPASAPLELQIDPQTKLGALAPKHRDAIHKAIARWLVKRKRALSLPEDKEFHDVFKIAMQGSYTPPDRKIILSNVLMLGAEGKQKLFDVNTSLRAAGIKPAMAGDIWSDRGVSLFGMCEYYMSENWEIKELLLAAKPFSERHTGDSIRKYTSDACVEAGLSDDVHSTVFFFVSDNAANMIAGWATFKRGPCVVHTGQLSAHVFLEHPRIKPMRLKERGITAHFSFCTGVDGLGALTKCQRDSNLPERHPVKDNGTHWSSGYDQMEWFRVQQRAVQLYDVDHARKAGDAYREHQLGLDDWRVNLESVAVMQPVADWTQHMQGTKSYPTLPLVLPTVYSLIEGMGPLKPLCMNFAELDAAYELEVHEMHNGVLVARTAMYADWVSRWITNIDAEAKRTYAIATLLHPYFKTYDFVDGFDLVPETDKTWALRELRSEWATVWKPPAQAAAAEPTPIEATAQVTTPVDSTSGHATKKRKVTLGSLLGGRMKQVATKDAAPVRVQLDELEQYLADEEEFTLDMPVLKWWQIKEAKWPNLAKMVKQYFAAPASSAGVERVFSAAGNMHGDLSKRTKDDTLEASLFAAFNTEWCATCSNLPSTVSPDCN